jgi:hypothetical protein
VFAVDVYTRSKHCMHQGPGGYTMPQAGKGRKSAARPYRSRPGAMSSQVSVQEITDWWGGGIATDYRFLSH